MTCCLKTQLNQLESEVLGKHQRFRENHRDFEQFSKPSRSIDRKKSTIVKPCHTQFRWAKHHNAVNSS